MSNAKSIVVAKLNVSGHIAGVSEGPLEWKEQAHDSLVRALRIRAALDLTILEAEMRKREVPEEVLWEFMQKAWVDDEAFTTLIPWP
jgi:hypothetical protein